MNKQEFITTLENRLSVLPAGERAKYMYFYRRTLDEKINSGITEEQAVSEMGTTDEIWDAILRENGGFAPTAAPSQTVYPPFKKNDSGKTVRNLLIIILGFPIWFPLALALFITLFSLIFSAWALCISFGFSSVVAIIGACFSLPGGALSVLFYLGIALIFAGICIASAVLSVYVTKWIGRFTAWIFGQTRKVLSL